MRLRERRTPSIPSWPGLTRPSRLGGACAHLIEITGTSPVMTGKERGVSKLLTFFLYAYNPIFVLLIEGRFMRRS